MRLTGIALAIFASAQAATASLASARALDSVALPVSAATHVPVLARSDDGEQKPQFRVQDCDKKDKYIRCGKCNGTKCKVDGSNM
ncbi:uncharacterized protein DSM5745_04824 [Aspergillus mulundensis]|uniref:Uncharacterized protein n=1 Tax=Aspergillus mulundensis TaxID=1810919 RepID=A0A3D8S4P8_9EURO|nr:hypothetical protein DSM5745_04824 [Aspergillus mulundensis]RDW81267.1 hypothetical protein DSM5745_04824 [Aspergillus mulundensis]